MRKSTVSNLNSFKELSFEARLKIEKQNYSLITKFGAKLIIEGIQDNLVKVNVRNINGKRTPKCVLLDESYKILVSSLPSGYRVSIRL